MAFSMQPGGRVPAPGELGFVQAFINSHYDLEFEHGVDLFGTPDRLAAWLGPRDLIGARESAALDARDVRRAIRLREALRSIARANGDPSSGAPADALGALDRAARGVAIVVRFTPAGPRFTGAGTVGIERAIALVVAITARAMIDGSWSRLKVCPGEDCGWAFYDQSRNQSGRWCSMGVCGGRAKARAYYRRRRGAE
jgi:predicted RNA-binding Zn ribbon-like protein